MRLAAALLFGSALLAADLLAGDPGSLHIKSALASYQAGTAAAHDSHFEAAIDQFHRAIEIEPTFQEAFEGLIAADLSSGQRSDAAAAATQLLEIEPELIKYRLLLGQILSEQNQPQRALAQFSFVLKTSPFNADALLGFASAAKRLGMDERAADAMKKGRKQYPFDERFSG